MIGGSVVGVLVLAGLGIFFFGMLGGESDPQTSVDDRVAAARQRVEEMRSRSGVPRGNSNMPRGAAEVAAHTERLIKENERAIEADIAKMEADMAAAEKSGDGGQAEAYIDTALVSDVSGHRRAVTEFVQLVGEFGDLLEKTKGNLTADSRATLRELEERAWTLSDRIAAVPRLNAEGAQQASRLLQHDAQGMQQDKRVQQQVEQYRGRVSGRSNLISFNKATGRLSEARQAILNASTAPKKPWGLVQDLEYRLYDANRAVLHAAFSSDQAAIGDAIVKYTRSLQSYKQDWGFHVGTKDKPFSDAKSPFSGWYAWSTDALKRHVEPKLPSTLVAAYDEFMELQSSFEPQDMTAVQRIQAKHAKFHEEAQNHHQSSMSSDSNDRQAGDPADDWALGQQIKFFRGENVSGTVIVHLDKSIDFFKQSKVFEALKNDLGLKNRPQALPGSSRWALGIKFDGPLQKVVEAIHFGEVTQTEQNQRVLYCKVAAEWASK